MRSMAIGGIRLIRPPAAGHPRVALGPTDDEQQRKVGTSTAGHRASSRPPPVATWTAALIPRRPDGPRDEQTAGGRPGNGRPGGGGQPGSGGGGQPGSGGGRSIDGLSEKN